jgi:hypothetical protein
MRSSEAGDAALWSREAVRGNGGFLHDTLNGCNKGANFMKYFTMPS